MANDVEHFLYARGSFGYICSNLLLVFQQNYLSSSYCAVKVFECILGAKFLYLIYDL